MLKNGKKSGIFLYQRCKHEKINVNYNPNLFHLKMFLLLALNIEKPRLFPAVSFLRLKNVNRMEQMNQMAVKL